MAENQEKGSTGAAPVLVMVDPQRNAAQQLAAEMTAKKAAGIKLDEGVPGGHFLGTDGEPHDAHGRPIKQGRAVGAVSPEDAAARLRELDEEREALRAQLAVGTAAADAQAEAQAKAEASSSEPDEPDERGKPAKATKGTKK